MTVTQLLKGGTYLFGALRVEIGAYLPTYPERLPALYGSTYSKGCFRLRHILA